MKKILFLLAFLFCVGKVHSAGLYQVGNTTIFRTSVPAVATELMFIATGSIYVHSILVSSTSAGSESTCLIANTTGTFNGGVTLTTYTYSTGWTANPYPAFEIPVNRVFHQGAIFSNRGSAKIELRWDWLSGKAQPGQDDKGR